MKAKIYPLNNMTSETSIWASPFCLHLQIICASLAKGVSTIKNLVESNDINTTIKWCENIGASIKKSNNKLIIKGVDNEISFKSSLFICNETLTTAKLMLPLLSVSFQPFGIKADEALLDELESLSFFYDSYGINCYRENEMIRFENIMESGELEFDGSIDIYLSAGILMALPLLQNRSLFKLRAPVRCEKSYNLILKTLKNFKVDIKHPSTMRYEVLGKQKYKACNITSPIDNYMLSIVALLTHKLEFENVIKISNYKSNKLSNEYALFSFIKKNIASHKKIFSKDYLKKKNFSYHKITFEVENSLPFLMILGVINTQDTIITKVDFSNPRIKKQYEIMAEIFSKLKLQCCDFDNEIVISPSKVDFKKQIDCKNDPYVAISISILAMFSNYPIIIKNADCVFNIYNDFYLKIKEFGATVEFIHDN